MAGERSDEALLEAIGARDLDALESLYSRYIGFAFALALRVVGNRETAEEVVHDSFLAVWRGASTYRVERGSVRSWLIGIIHHRAIDVVRARRSRGEALPLDERFVIASDADPWREVQQSLDREAIRQALLSLPSEQRQSIELAYFGGFTYPEIATRLNVPLGTVKSRLRLGLGKLRAQMSEASTPRSEAGHETYGGIDDEGLARGPG